MKPPSGPKGHFLLGSLPELRRDFLGFLTACARQYGDIVQVRAGTGRLLLISHPRAIENVLTDCASHLTKSLRLKQHLSPLLGEGLLLSEGELWLRQRRTMQPAFQQQRLLSYGEVMIRYAQLITAGWKSGQIVDIHSQMTLLTQAIIAKALFDVDIDDTRHSIGPAFHAAMRTLSEQRKSLRRFLRTPTSRSREEEALNRVVYDIIASRQATGEVREDLLSLLLCSQEKSGSAILAKQVRDEIVTLFLAGYETTAFLLSATCFLLAQCPAVQARVEAELDAVLSGRSPRITDLPRLRYTEMVVKESLRLYPPSHAIYRSAAASFEVAGYHIHRNALIVMSQWVVHRDPRWFDSPEAFRPDRWEGGRLSTLPRFAYFPFGGGVRRCPGNNFALMGAQIVLATILQRFRFQTVPGESANQLDALYKRQSDMLRMVIARRATC